MVERAWKGMDVLGERNAAVERVKDAMTAVIQKQIALKQSNGPTGYFTLYKLNVAELEDVCEFVKSFDV